MNIRTNSYFDCPINSYNSLDGFLKGKAEITEIKFDIGKSLYLYHRTSGYKTLTIFFKAARRLEKEKVPPFFTGLNVTSSMPTDILCIDDIANQYEGVELGWHAGTFDIRTQKILPEVIDRFITIGGYEKIIFTGGSGGGYAALYYGSFFPNSIIFSVNPQTDILRYYRKQSQNYIEKCFPSYDIDKIYKYGYIPNIISSLINFMKDKEMKVFYLQNIDDTYHLREHMFPFMKSIGARPKAENQIINNFNFIFGNWGKGHAALPADIYRKCLDNIIYNNIIEIKNIP